MIPPCNVNNGVETSLNTNLDNQNDSNNTSIRRRTITRHRKSSKDVNKTNTKHSRVEKDVSNLWTIFLSEGGVLIPQIVSSFSVRDLLSFEAAIRAHLNPAFTKHAWQNFRKEAGYNFDWKACSKETHLDKWNYCLSAALVKYIEQQGKTRTPLKGEIKNKDLGKKVYDQFQGLINRFPSFGSFFQEEISNLFGKRKINQKIRKGKKIVLKAAQEEKWGGELLLQGLFEINVRPISSRP